MLGMLRHMAGHARTRKTDPSHDMELPAKVYLVWSARSSTELALLDQELIDIARWVTILHMWNGLHSIRSYVFPYTARLLCSPCKPAQLTACELVGIASDVRRDLEARCAVLCRIFHATLGHVVMCYDRSSC